MLVLNSDLCKRSTYDPYSIMHYPKWAFARTPQAEDDCFNRDIDSACTILPKPGSGISRDRMGESEDLTSRDASGIFLYYRDRSPCRGTGSSLCTWRSYTVSTSRPGTYSFTLSSSGKRSVVVQGNQMPVRVSLQRKNSNGSYTTLKSTTGPTDTLLGLYSDTLSPGTYRWHVIATSGSGSVDVFPKG